MIEHEPATKGRFDSPGGSINDRDIETNVQNEQPAKPVNEVKVDQLGRTHIVDPWCGKRIGNLGRFAEGGRPERVKKPVIFEQKQWNKAKREWERMNDEQRGEYEQTLRALPAAEKVGDLVGQLDNLSKN